MPDNIANSGRPAPVREYWLNADFDRSLGPNPPVIAPADLTHVREMAWHFAFAPGPGDSLIAYRPLPAGFTAYIADKGFALPAMRIHPDYDALAEFTPFGWNAEAEGLAARYERPAAHPALAAVRQANSRAFALDLEKADDPAHAGAIFAESAELARELAGKPAGTEWIVKGDHGYAGTGNHRVPCGTLSAADRARVDAILADHGKAVLEPWHVRLEDMAMLFRTDAAGGLRDFRGHRLLNSRDGAFLGVHVAPDGLPPEPWREALRAQASRLAAALAAIGYHGPVGVDAYAHATPEGPRLRPLVDVNARLSMALPAHGLARRLPDRHVFWTWTKPRKLRLPADYAGLDAALGPDAYDPRARRGILAVSPLRLEDGAPRGPEDTLRPRRVGFALIARDGDELDALRASFTRALGRSA